MFEFRRKQPTSLELAPSVRLEPATLEQDLVTIEFPNVRAIDTLDVAAQTPQELATAVPGDALDIVTQDAHMEGHIYTLGQTPVFITQRVTSPHRPETDEDCIENRVKNVERTIDADKQGQWFEHVYPLNKDVREALNGELYPLIQYSRQTGSFFVIAVVDQAYVVMPATMNQKVWEQGPSKRYAQYANLRDGFNELATQAMIYIDPGENSGLTNSEQLGCMDADLPAGQLQYDVDSEGAIVDSVSEDLHRGRRFKTFRTITDFGVGGSDYGYEISLEGVATEKRFFHEAAPEEKILAWKVTER